MTTSLSDPKISPMMVQWHACKAKAPAALLFFRLGDFYEAFYDDAALIARELDLTLTKRGDIPMAGVPYHSSEGYIDRLVALGYNVAIAEQMEDPRQTKGLVHRDIARIVTPGTVITSSLLHDKSNNYLACIAQVSGLYGLSVLDLTTADFRALEFDDLKLLLDELCRLSPKEIILSEKWNQRNQHIVSELKSHLSCAVNCKEEWHFDHAFALDFLLRHFKIHHLDGFGLKGMTAAINASGALLHYVGKDLNLSIDHIKSLVKETTGAYMLIDRATQKHLELTLSLQENKKSHTLLHLIDHTETAMGGRLLKKWLSHPLLDPSLIGERQDAVHEFLDKNRYIQDVCIYLQEIKDLERLMMRIETGYALPRDLGALRDSLKALPHLFHAMRSFTANILKNSAAQLCDMSAICNKLQHALVETPPLRLSDGGIFKESYHPDLEALIALKSDHNTWVAQYQTQLKEQTQIKTLKVGYTKAFGFYIEVSRGQVDKIPTSFQRRQTLTNAERYITEELKDYEQQMLHAEERLAALEQALFAELLKEIRLYSSHILCIAQSIAHIDALLSLARCALKHRWVRPLVDNSDLIDIEQGRHPVVESVLKKETFVPNDVLLNADTQRMYLITGPNMAGKSTFIRQVALICILAQIGSFVPAHRAHLGIIDKVFSRIGASDDLSRGQSTFMVEMTETANILNNATDRSLVILDEIGRGTSTYDGIAIAWAVAEHLLTYPGKRAKTLFATHYWELNQLEKKIPGAINFNVAVHESPEGIIFLRKIVRGGTDKSYGIHVAKLAGLPHVVVKRAQSILADLEAPANKPAKNHIKKVLEERQLSLFDT